MQAFAIQGKVTDISHDTTRYHHLSGSPLSDWLNYTGSASDLLKIITSSWTPSDRSTAAPTGPSVRNPKAKGQGSFFVDSFMTHRDDTPYIARIEHPNAGNTESHSTLQVIKPAEDESGSTPTIFGIALRGSPVISPESSFFTYPGCIGILVATSPMTIES